MSIKQTQPSEQELDGGFAQLLNIDRLIHEPGRLLIMAYLSAVNAADFLFIMRQTGLSRGNLSSHMSKLEEAGYISVEKRFAGKIPQTLLKLTPKGRRAFNDYRVKMQDVLDALK